ncbi:hypothetical protein D9M68_799180 [compost metagenome]
MRADEFGRVQRALFERLVHVAGRHVLRHHAQLGHGLAEHAAAHAHLQALEVFDGLDFLAIPAAHLRAGVAGAGRAEVVLREEGVEQLAAVAVLFPRVVLAGREAEGNGAAEREDRVLAGEVVSGGLRHFERVGLQGIDHAECGHQLAGGVHRDFELAAGQGLDRLREHFSAAEDGVQGAGEARGQAPANRGLRMDGRGDASGQNAGDARVFDEGTTIH